MGPSDIATWSREKKNMPVAYFWVVGIAGHSPRYTPVDVDMSDRRLVLEAEQWIDMDRCR